MQKEYYASLLFITLHIKYHHPKRKKEMVNRIKRLNIILWVQKGNGCGKMIIGLDWCPNLFPLCLHSNGLARISPSMLIIIIYLHLMKPQCWLLPSPLTAPSPKFFSITQDKRTQNIPHPLHPYRPRNKCAPLRRNASQVGRLHRNS